MLPVVIIVSFSIQSNRRNPIAVTMHCLVIIFQVVNRIGWSVMIVFDMNKDKY